VGVELRYTVECDCCGEGFGCMESSSLAMARALHANGWHYDRGQGDLICAECVKRGDWSSPASLSPITYVRAADLRVSAEDLLRDNEHSAK